MDYIVDPLWAEMIEDEAEIADHRTPCPLKKCDLCSF
jgi:hypothetical protein